MTTFRLPRKFYEDHRERGCGETGVIVKELKAQFVVELDVRAWRDLWSDADYYAGFADEDFAQNRGLCMSAKRVVAILDADRPTADELAADEAAERVEWEAGRPERERQQAEHLAHMAAREAERQAELAAHPRLYPKYIWPQGFGIEIADDLKVGARIHTQGNVFEVVELGERDRGLNHQAVLVLLGDPKQLRRNYKIERC